jgi:hypothetical protein
MTEFGRYVLGVLPPRLQGRPKNNISNFICKYRHFRYGTGITSYLIWRRP